MWSLGRWLRHRWRSYHAVDWLVDTKGRHLSADIWSYGVHWSVYRHLCLSVLHWSPTVDLHRRLSNVSIRRSHWCGLFHFALNNTLSNEKNALKSLRSLKPSKTVHALTPRSETETEMLKFIVNNHNKVCWPVDVHNYNITMYVLIYLYFRTAESG